MDKSSFDTCHHKNPCDTLFPLGTNVLVLDCLRKLFYHLEIDYTPFICYNSREIQISKDICYITIYQILGSTLRDSIKFWFENLKKYRIFDIVFRLVFYTKK